MGQHPRIDRIFFIGIGAAVYKGQNLFLLRQFASKMRTMQFTMGTLTALFTLALLGASFALMFSDYENSVLRSRRGLICTRYCDCPSSTFS